MSGLYPSTRAPEDLFRAATRQASEISRLQGWAADHDEEERRHMEQMTAAISKLTEQNVALASTVAQTIAWGKGILAAVAALLTVAEVIRAFTH